MSNSNANDNLAFDLPKNQSSTIKVIGVGGGGSNAVNHMYGLNLTGVDFIVSNTDAQALENSPVPNKIQLGVSLTEGLGAGANPEIGEQAAQESINEIKDILSTNTKMVFITAGMGGGTGTGAAPVIARAAKDMGILTVGIVTIPFIFEGNARKQQAEKGVDALRKSVDSLVVINNNKLREVYGNLGFKAGFAKADEVLATAARGIAEVITHHYTANIDLRDAKTVLANSGTAIMGADTASGENRASKAIAGALDSPLLNDNHIRGAKNVLLLIVSGQDEITIDEIGEINDFIQAEAGGDANIIMGIGDNPDLEEGIAVTVVATGFNPDQQEQTIGRTPDKVIHTLEDDQEVSSSVYNKPLSMEEDEEDDIIESELERNQAREREDQLNRQQRLFFEEEEEDPLNSDHSGAAAPDEPRAEKEPEEDASQDPHLPTERHEEPSREEEESPQTEAENEEKAYFSLEEEDEEAKLSQAEEPESPLFEIGDSEEEPQKKQDPEPEAKQTEEQNEEPPVKRYTLEDYSKLEKQLNEAGKEESKASDKEEEDMEFKVEKRQEHTPKASKSSRVNPMDMPIAESMKMRAEERQAKLKAFNYRFKNHPNGTSEANHEPAYKRHGIDIDNERHSSKQKQSRFSVDDSEDGPDIKNNNSFLHDNVD